MIPVFVMFSIKKDAQTWLFLLPMCLVFFLLIIESCRYFCFMRSIKIFNQYLKQNNFRHDGFLIRNGFRTKSNAICGWDMCIKKYLFDVNVYESHAVNVVKFKNYLKAKNQNNPQSDLQKAKHNFKRETDSLDDIDPMQFSPSYDDELQCNTGPSTPFQSRTQRKVESNYVLDTTVIRSKRRLSKSELHLIDDEHSYNDEKDSTNYDLVGLGVESGRSSKILKFPNFIESEKNSNNKYQAFFENT